MVLQGYFNELKSGHMHIRAIEWGQYGEGALYSLLTSSGCTSIDSVATQITINY